MTPAPPFAQAVALFQQGRLDAAAEICARILAAAPQDFPAQYLCGVILFTQGRAGDALAAYDRALALNSGEAELFYNRGNALHALNRFAEALESYERAVTLAPGFAPAWNNRGNAFKALGNADAALASYERVLALDPRAAPVWKNRGNLLQDARRFDEALESYDRALALDPALADAWLDRAGTLRWLRRGAEALESLRHALAARPDWPQAHNLAATVLRDLGRIAEARQAYGHAIAAQPDYAEALFHRGTLEWIEARDLGAAIADVERAVALDPGMAYAPGFLLHLKMYAADWRGFDDLRARVDAGLAAGEAVIEPFALLALSQSPQAMQACAVTFNRHRYPAAALPAAPRRGGDRIRLGYMSGEFQEQATAYLMAQIYERHDKARFELMAIDNGSSDDSPMRRRLEAAFDHMIAIANLPDLEAARRIQAAGIDILVDLNGYFGTHRTGVLAHKPAPLQVNYLGFPGTLGAPYMDYIIADKVVIPEDEARFYTEQVAWLPGCYQANSARAQTDVAPSRTACGLPETGFVFASFNSGFKLTPDMFALWLRLLAAVPDSVLWLLEVNALFADNLRCAAAAAGVAPQRLVFAPLVPQAGHMARIALADLFLDCAPCNAHTTASDALWAGLPLLTLRGHAFAGRVAASLLQAAGLPELVTESLEDYESMALGLAREPQRLQALRDRLIAARATAPLFDSAILTRSLESAYALMWERHSQGEAPRGFSV